MPRKLSGSAIVPGTITVTQIAGNLNDTSNAAYGQANTARTQANSAYGQANAAYTAANNAKVTVYANSASDVTTQKINFVNTATITVAVSNSGGNANVSFTAVGGAAYDQANAAYGQANTARDQANTARNQANAAYGQANSGVTIAGNAYAQANSGVTIGGNAYGQANTARTQANAAYGQANAAYGQANTRLSASGGTLSGDLIITGNLTVSGNQTILNTEVLTTEDADIVLLSNTSSTPALNAGLIVNRGTSTNTFLRWNEALDEWGWSDNGTTTYYFDDLRAGLATTNTTFGTINTSLGTINTSYQAAYAQANAAFAAANNRVLKAGDTMTGNLIISAAAGAGSGTFAGGVSLLRVQGSTSAFSEPRIDLGEQSLSPTAYIASKNEGNGGGSLIFGNRDTSSSSSTLTERMRITPTGSVGIGTTSPSARLDVRTAAGTSAQFNLYSGNNSTNTKISIGQIGAIDWDLGINASSGHFYIGGLGGSLNEAYRIERSGVDVNFHRWSTGAGTERMRIASDGNIQIGSAADAGNTLRFLDVYNTNTGSSAGAILRLITANTAGTGTTSVDIVKYKSGGFFINNNEPDSGAYTAFNVGSSERFKITPTGITSAGDRLVMGNVLTSTKTLDTTKWYRIATLSSSNQVHEIDLRVRILNSHANFVIRLSKGTGNWTAQAYRAGHYIAPAAGYAAINKVRIYDVGVNAETHIEIQVSGATESRQYEVVVVNSVTPSGTKPTLIDFTDQGTGSVGVEFLVTEVNASWGTPSGQNVVFRDNGNVGIGTASPTNKFEVVGNGVRSVAQMAANTSVADLEAQVQNYWGGAGGPTYTGTAISQYGSAASGTTAGLSNANLGSLRFQNGSAGLIYTNGGSPIVFGTAATERMRISTTSIDVSTTVSMAFGSQTRQMLNLWSTSYGLGVQSGTLYYRSGSRFSWHRGGSHNDNENNPGGGTVAMTLDGSSNLNVTGDITAFFSDDRLKNKLGNIDNALSKVLTLNGFYYEPNQTAMDLGYEKKKQVGVSAQEVKEVLPEVVVAAPIDDKYMTVHYHKLVPLLIEAIKELNVKIQDMQKIIESKN